MKKFLSLFIAVLTIGIFSIGSCAFAEQGYINTSATSQIELVPDTVNFSVEIITTSKDSMAKAISENKRIASNVYDNLRKTLEKTSGDCIKTSSYSAVPVYKYNNGKRIFDYYQVTNSCKIHTKNINEVGKMMDKAIADGATSVTNVTYDVSNYEAECNKLLAQTALKAKEQAESIAKSINSEITGVKSIDSSCSMTNRNTVMPRMYSAKAMSLADEATGSTEIEVGTMTLNARVNVNFYVK